MKRVMVCIAVLLIVVVSMAQDPNLPQDPNSVEPNAPRKIVMPKGTKMPPMFKCAKHGVIGEAIFILETEEFKTAHCKKCALKFVSDLFTINLPKTELVND